MSCTHEQTEITHLLPSGLGDQIILPFAGDESEVRIGRPKGWITVQLVNT